MYKLPCPSLGEDATSFGLSATIPGLGPFVASARQEILDSLKKYEPLVLNSDSRRIQAFALHTPDHVLIQTVNNIHFQERLGAQLAVLKVALNLLPSGSTALAVMENGQPTQVDIEGYIGEDGKLYLKWNPTCAAEDVNKANSQVTPIILGDSAVQAAKLLSSDRQVGDTQQSARGRGTAQRSSKPEGTGQGNAKEKLLAYKNLVATVQARIGSQGPRISGGTPYGSGTSNTRQYRLCCPDSGSCFVPGTQVHGIDELCLIEEIRCGQQVYTY